ncbi:MAG: recombinase RecT [Helicobacter sp.]|uniref:recombinase RecT n=1 Tax=Helicobacter sp. TaxID=218 RepID=UPI002A920B94|nr:recombinase RecT [Helicobacter sp.]MDY5951074.1 recombinase RecT [Helicobacter sp.]
MSNNMIQQRKNEVMVLLENKEIQERLCALCGSEASKDKFKASLDIAGLKLNLNKNLGKAYIVPRSVRQGNGYVTEARIDIGYKGWLELAKRSKLSVKAHSVFDCDEFSYNVVGVDENMTLIPKYA